MADFFWTYLWPLIIMVAQSVLLLVILLVAIAYVLLADRKIWAAVQIRRGPNVVGPCGRAGRHRRRTRCPRSRGRAASPRPRETGAAMFRVARARQESARPARATAQAGAAG